MIGMVVKMKPILLIQLALLILAGALITYHFVAFSTTLLLVIVGLSVIIGNAALFAKLYKTSQNSH